jgi:hypothetical protein
VVAAGAFAIASDVNSLGQNEFTANATSVTQAVTTTLTDLAGATKTIITPVANTVVSVTGYFDIEANGMTDIFLGFLASNAVTQTGEAHWQAVGRATIAQHWTLTLGAAGSYTLKLRIQKILNTNTLVVYGSGHSKITISGKGITV